MLSPEPHNLKFIKNIECLISGVYICFEIIPHQKIILFLTLSSTFLGGENASLHGREVKVGGGEIP